MIGVKAGLEGAAGTSISTTEAGTSVTSMLTGRWERKKLRERYLLFGIESDIHP